MPGILLHSVRGKVSPQLASKILMRIHRHTLSLFDSTSLSFSNSLLSLYYQRTNAFPKPIGRSPSLRFLMSPVCPAKVPLDRLSMLSMSVPQRTGCFATVHHCDVDPLVHCLRPPHPLGQEDATVHAEVVFADHCGSAAAVLGPHHRHVHSQHYDPRQVVVKICHWPLSSKSARVDASS